MAKWTMNDAFDGLNELTERKRRVLWAIVQDYSSTAESRRIILLARTNLCASVSLLAASLI